MSRRRSRARDLAQMLVMPDAIVYVRTKSGADIQGRFVRASTQALVMSGLDGREVTLTVEEVMFVWRRGDSLRNGAIIGALVGVAGAVGGQSTCSDCSAEVAAGIGSARQSGPESARSSIVSTWDAR